MKFSALVCALSATSVASFAPSVTERASTSLKSLDRRAAFGQIAGAAAVVAAFPQFANADGAVSAATVGRSRGIYGDRIAALKPAVEKGDFDAIVAEKGAFVLFNSGAYPKNKASKKAAIEGTNAIFKAIKAGDKAALKTAYGNYIAANNIKPFPVVDSNKGQGYSGDFDYRVKTSAGAIYVR